MATSLIFISKVHASDISPDKYYIDINTTDSLNQKLTIYANPIATKSAHVFITALGMRKNGEGDDREFFTPDSKNNAEPANWISFDKTELNIAPKETAIINWKLTPKSIVSCGTALAAIGVTENQVPDANSPDSVVGVKNTTISQLHINIIKFNSEDCTNTKTNLSLLDFKVNSPLPIFNFDNVPFLTRIQNNSKFISRKPEGFIEIFGFGDKITIPFNEKQLDIYPITTRSFDNQWIDSNYPHNGNFFEQVIYEISHLRIGKYEARLGVTNNVTNQIKSSASFWIIPWRILLLILIIILLIGTIIIKGRKKPKKIKSKKNNV